MLRGTRDSTSKLFHSYHLPHTTCTKTLWTSSLQPDIHQTPLPSEPQNNLWLYRECVQRQTLPKSFKQHSPYVDARASIGYTLARKIKKCHKAVNLQSVIYSCLHMLWVFFLKDRCNYLMTQEICWLLTGRRWLHLWLLETVNKSELEGYIPKHHLCLMINLFVCV